MSIISLSACDKLRGDVSRGQLLAEVGSQQLYLSDADGIVPPGLANADSVQVLSDYVGRWVRDAAVSEEAIAQLGDNPDLERLVDQYRTSLARDRYETMIASKRIDTTVTQQQLEQTYENSKAGLSAKQALVQAILIKMPTPVPNKAEFEEAWRNIDAPEQWALCQQMAREHSSLALLDKQKWYSTAEIEVLLPNRVSGSIREGSSVSTGDGHVYYLRINALVNEGEVTPLPYVRERLGKIILEQRKSAFLGTYTEEIYQAARTQNRVKIYIGNDQ
ncbi:MAG: glycoside hydrolase family 15 protein [Saprospiraceae bacterium]